MSYFAFKFGDTMIEVNHAMLKILAEPTYIHVIGGGRRIVVDPFV